MTLPTFGDRLRQRRQLLGLSPKQLAARTGLTYGVLCELECDAATAGRRALHLLAKVLHQETAQEMTPAQRREQEQWRLLWEALSEFFPGEPDEYYRRESKGKRASNG